MQAGRLGFDSHTVLTLAASSRVDYFLARLRAPAGDYPQFEIIRSSRFLEVTRRGRIVAIPIFDASILGLDKSQTASG